LGINPLRRSAAVILMAAGAVVLVPAPAQADYVCWMSDGIRYCYDPGDRQVPEEPPPAPVVEPPYTPPAYTPPLAAPVPAQPAPAPPSPHTQMRGQARWRARWRRPPAARRV